MQLSQSPTTATTAKEPKKQTHQKNSPDSFILPHIHTPKTAAVACPPTRQQHSANLLLRPALCYSKHHGQLPAHPPEASRSACVEPRVSEGGRASEQATATTTRTVEVTKPCEEQTMCFTMEQQPQQSDQLHTLEATDSFLSSKRARNPQFCCTPAPTLKRLPFHTKTPISHAESQALRVRVRVRVRGSECTALPLTPSLSLSHSLTPTPSLTHSLVLSAHTQRPSSLKKAAF